MQSNIVFGLIALVAVFGIIAIFIKASKREGRLKTELDAVRERLEDVNNANKIKDRLDNDPEYAKRMRDDFTRD